MRKTLITFAAVVTSLVQATVGWAQAGTFSGTVDEIQTAPAGEVVAYYVPSTGDVILSVGPGLLVVGVSGSADSVADDFIVENFDNSTPLGGGTMVGPNDISFLTFFGSLPTGVFNIGPILPADSAITNGVMFDDAFGGLLRGTGGLPGQLFELPFQVVADPNALLVRGDFNGDSVVDLSDLDQYIGRIDIRIVDFGIPGIGNLNQLLAAELAPLDLDADGEITLDDFEIHFSQLVETSNGQTGTLAGDANLDGTVNVLDACVLIENLGSVSTSWAAGDFNADGRIDVLSDAFTWLRNLGQSN